MTGVGLQMQLLARRGQMAWNTMFHGSRTKRIAACSLIGFGILGELAFFSVAGFVVSFQKLHITPSFVAGLLTLVTMFTAATAITFALSSLYFSRDLDLLRSIPMAAHHIIWHRVLVQWCVGMGLGVVVSSPFVLGAVVYHRAWSAIPILILAIGAVVLLTFSIMTALTVVLLRIVPARWVKNAGAIVVVGTGTVVAGLNVVLRISSFTGGAGLATVSVTPFSHTPLSASWSPIAWASRAIADAFAGSVGSGLLWLLPTVAVSIGVTFLCIRGAEQVYVEGYERNASAGNTGSKRRMRVNAFGARPRIWKTIGIKDFIEIRRDASLLAMLILPLIMFGLYVGVAAPPIPVLHTTWLAPLFVASSTSLFTAAGLALRGIGGEGGRLWLIKASPNPVRSVIAAKFVIGLVVTAILSAILLWVGMVRHALTVPGVVEATVLLIGIISGLVGIATGLGAMWPRLDWTDPRRAVSIWLTLAFLGIATLYLAIAFVVIGMPFVLNIPLPWGTYLAYIGVYVWAAVVGGSFMTVGAARYALREV